MKIYEAKITYNVKSEKPALKLDDPYSIANLMRETFEKNPMQESVWVILLNHQHICLGKIMIGLGSVCSCVASIKDILKPAILASASNIVICHNHPSGETGPSQADINLTTKLKKACELVEINLVDHIIVGDGYYSFCDSGLLS